MTTKNSASDAGCVCGDNERKPDALASATTCCGSADAVAASGDPAPS